MYKIQNLRGFITSAKEETTSRLYQHKIQFSVKIAWTQKFKKLLRAHQYISSELERNVLYFWTIKTGPGNFISA